MPAGIRNPSQKAKYSIRVQDFRCSPDTGHAARRPFFVMADLAKNARRKAEGKKPALISPLALEAMRRIDALFEIERAIN